MRFATRRGAHLALFGLGLTLGLASATARADEPTADQGAMLPLAPAESADPPAIGSPPALAGLEGKPIGAVVVRVRGTWGQVPPPSSLRVGDPLDRVRARMALRELLDRGDLANAALSVEPQGEQARLVFDVEPRRILRQVSLEGGVLEGVATLRTARLKDGDLVTEADLERARTDVTRFYEARGFRGPRVTMKTMAASREGEIDLTITIAPGPIRFIDLRVFVIDPIEDAEVGDLKREYAVSSGDRPDEDALSEADRKLTDLLREKGFLRAQVSHLVRPVGDGAQLQVRIRSGPRIEPIFEGARAFDADQLRQAFGERGTASGTEEELRERVRDFYIRRGFLDVKVDTEVRVGKGAVEHLVFKLREGTPVRVKKRVFPCLPAAFDPDDVGEEIESFLDEELPSGSFSPPAEGVLSPRSASGSRLDATGVDVTARYAPETYNRAVKHLRELFASRGYLHAAIGPVRVVRARCSAASTSRRCVEEAAPPVAPATCAVDTTGLPVPEPTPPEATSCVADPARGIECAPEVVLRIPMNLGPQTILYDVRFDVATTEGGVKSDVPETLLALVAGLPLGDPLSNQGVEDARQRLLDYFRDRGHYYAEVRSDLELSPDRTRGRVRFSISPREVVRVRSIEIRGARFTDADVVRRRLVFGVGDVYGKGAVRTSEERIATLGPFTSVTIALENPEIPERDKNVLVTVAEDLPIYVEPRIGFSTGEGLRGGLEVGHRTLWGEAISLTVRTQFAYLFDFMILDDDVRDNLAPLPKLQRLERRNSIRMVFPEIGLGPLFGLALEGIDLRDNQRDFGLTRDAFVPSLLFRPSREVSAQLANSLELNDVKIFNASTVEEAVRNNRSLERLLRFPDGRTFAVAQRISGAWDRRDNAFSATRGTLFSAEIEHVNAFPADDSTRDTNPITSHFLRLTGRVAGYVRLSKQGLALALSMSSGGNIQLVDGSKTYPDRLFYMGGFDSHRAFLTDSMIPEDVAQRILNPGVGTPANERITEDDIGVRGGDLRLNPRAELRVPLGETFATALFLDAGNLWVDPAAVDPLAMRLGAGSGIRVNTPIGPLALDYGINLARRRWEDFGALHFSVGLF